MEVRLDYWRPSLLVRAEPELTSSFHVFLIFIKPHHFLKSIPQISRLNTRVALPTRPNAPGGATDAGLRPPHAQTVACVTESGCVVLVTESGCCWMTRK